MRSEINTQFESRRSQRISKKEFRFPLVSSQAIGFLVEGSRHIVLTKIQISLNIEDDLKTFNFLEF